MIRRYLLTLQLLLSCALGAMAAGNYFIYYPEYTSGEMTIYFRLVDTGGMELLPQAMNVSYERYFIGAFINGDCRGEAEWQMSQSQNGGFYKLTIYGDADIDNGSTVTLTVAKSDEPYYGGGRTVREAVYPKSSYSTTFTAGTVQGSERQPYTLIYRLASAISMPEDIYLTLNEAVDPCDFVEVTPAGSAIYRPDWDFLNSMNWLYMANHQLRPTAVTPAEGVYFGLDAMDENGNSISASTRAHISEPQPQTTPLQLYFTQEEAYFPVGEDITDRLREMLGGNFDEATDPTFYWEIKGEGIDASDYLQLLDNRITTLKATSPDDWLMVRARPADDEGDIASMRVHIYKESPKMLYALADPLTIELPAGVRDMECSELIYGNLAVQPEGLDVRDYHIFFKDIIDSPLEIKYILTDEEGNYVYNIMASYPGTATVVASITVPDYENDPSGETIMELMTSFEVVITEEKVLPTAVRWSEDYANGITMLASETR